MLMIELSASPVLIASVPGVSARPAPANLTDLRLTLSRAEREFASREFDDCVNVLKRASVGKDDKDDKNGADGDDDGPDTDHMFGFTQGSDIIEKGKVEISGEAVGAFSKRVGRYRAGRLIGSFDFAPADCLSIEFGARGNAFSIRNVPNLDNRHSGGFSGFSHRDQWQAVKRGPSFPFGLTFVIEPDVTIRDDEAGARGRGVGLETRLALDTEIVPKTVFGAVNLLYEIEKFRPRVLRRFNSEGELLEGPPSGACPVNADD